MSAETQAVLDHHLSAFDSGDMEALLSDYAADAVLLTPEGVFRGHGQIGPVLQRLFDNLFARCQRFEMLRQDAEGEAAYIVWSAESDTHAVPLATDTFVIRGGKIVVQTMVTLMEGKGGQ